LSPWLDNSSKVRSLIRESQDGSGNLDGQKITHLRDVQPFKVNK
jgi:hypothetical protein